MYDSIGNLVQDKQENVTSIKWNVYGKVTEVNRTATAGNAYTKIVYNYDAQGNRIGKVSHQGNGRQDYTWYVRDAQGNLMSTYKATNSTPAEPANLQNLFLTQDDVYIYGSSRLGMLARGTNAVDNGNSTGPWINPFYNGDNYNRGYRQYELTNHLGNVLTVISDRNKGVSSGGSLTLPNGATIPAVDYYDPDMVAANDYYPFGMLSRTMGTPDKYRYGFNGQENDNEIKGRGNVTTAAHWEYDARIGRRWNVDPVYKHSPYEAFGGNPIAFSDPSGADTIKFTRTSMIATSSRSKFSGAGGIRPDATATFSINVVPAKGPDIFVYTNTVTRIIDGQSTTTTTTTYLNPEDTKSAKGVTKGKSIYFDGWWTESRNNKDWETVGKFMNLDKGFHDYMVARNPRAAGWRAKALSLEAGEHLLPVLVQNGLGAYAGFRIASAQSMRLAGFGDDAAITSNMANLTPKRGWYDVVVHGTEDGLAFTMNKQLVTPNQLYNMMLANGYQQGTKIRLMSCYSGSVPNGAAVQLSKLANAPVMAPTGALSIFPKGSFMVNYGQQFYIESSAIHETGKMLFFK